MRFYEELLEVAGERADDAAIARLVVERDAADSGERVSLDELLVELGFDRRELEEA
jgi:hypothetical protein